MLNLKTTNTILYCQHWQEMLHFYQHQLKLPVLMARSWFVEFELTETSRLSIAYAAKTSIESNAGKGITLTFAVEDIEATQAYLQQAGIPEVAIKKHAWGARIIHIYDPEGNRLEFWCASVN